MLFFYAISLRFCNFTLFTFLCLCRGNANAGTLALLSTPSGTKLSLRLRLATR